MNEFVAKNGIITPAAITATGSITSVAGFVGSLTGTASWASSALTASLAANTLSQSISSTTINANYFIDLIPSSSGNQPSFVSTGTTINPSTGLLTTNFVSASSFTGSLTGSVVGNLVGTSSWATNAVTAITALTASSLNFTPLSSSYAGTASILLGSVTSASYGLSSSYAGTASVLVGLPIDNSSSLTQVSQSNVVVVQRITGSYVAAFYDYTIFSASNSRAGTAFGTWNGSSVAYTEFATTDIGNTAPVTMSLILSSSTSATFVQLVTNAGQFINWNVRAIGRYI